MRRRGRVSLRLIARAPATWRLAALLAAVASPFLLSCEGDTLYPPSSGGNVGAPSVFVVSPEAGTQVLAGRTFPVRVVATDSLGVSLIQIEYSGAASGLIKVDFNPPQTTAEVDTVIVAPVGVGQLNVRAVAKNSRGAVTRTEAVVVSIAGTDKIPPTVHLTAVVPPRAELTDSIRIHLTGADNPGGSGLASLGATVLALKGTRPDTQIVATPTRTFSPALSDSAVYDVKVATSAVTGVAVGETVQFVVFGFAVDSAGNCAATVPGSSVSLPCGSRAVAGTAVRISAEPNPPVPSVRVSGRSFALRTGAIVPDMVPDVARGRVYLSNMRASQIEVFDLAQLAFATPVTAGAQPWGLAFNIPKDTLIVANSGGTNVSFIGLSGTPREALERRLNTPNAPLFEVSIKTEGHDTIYSPSFHDFSDRPQFVAEDAAGRLLYSTKPTAAAPEGTMRVGVMEPGWVQPEVRILLAGGGRNMLQSDSAIYSIAHIDSLRVFVPGQGSELMELYDHLPGFPASIIRSGLLPIGPALDALRGQGSDVVWVRGRWNLALVGLHDTTYVAASGDHRYVAFGEGSTAAGRVILWFSDISDISNEITTADLVGNTSEHLVGVDLSGDGSLGLSRGLGGVYFWNTQDPQTLRLQGSNPVPAGSAGGLGGVLDPQHPGYTLTPGTHTLSYVATNTNSIAIVETVHYSKVGEIPLRDNIVGPLRASLPYGACSGSNCPLAKLYGVTSAGALVVVDVLPSDVHPF